MLFGDSWPALHGAVTHFPVALLLTAAFLDFCSFVFKKPKLRESSLILLGLAVVACIPTVITGRLTAGTLYSGSTEPPAIVSTHALFAYITSGIAAVLLAWRLAAKDKLNGGALWASLLASFVLAAIVGYTGHLGGQMVFGTGVSDSSGVAASVPAKAVDPQTAALIQTGAGLYNSNGCTGCHSIGGAGGHAGPDLTHEGAKQPDIAWQIKHLKDPTSINPNSTMPAYASLSDSQLKALGTFLVNQK